MARVLPLALVTMIAGCGCTSESRRSPCMVKVVGGAKLEPFHPWLTFQGFSAMLVDFIYVPVVDRAGRRGATEIVRSDAAELQLRLHTDTFHDGRQVTVADVVHSIQAVEGTHVTARALDERSLVVHFDEGARERALLEMDAILVAPATASEATPSWSPPPGSGPFVLVSASPERAVLVDRSGQVNLTISAVQGSRPAWALALTEGADLIVELPAVVQDFVPGWRAQPNSVHLTYYVLISPRARREGFADVLIAALGGSVPRGAHACGSDEGVCAALAAHAGTRVTPPPADRELELAYWGGDDYSAEAALRLVRRLDQFDVRADAHQRGLDELDALRASGEYDVLVSYTPLEGAAGGAEILDFERHDTGNAETYTSRSSKPDPTLVASWFVVNGLFAVRDGVALPSFPGVPAGRAVAWWVSDTGCVR